MIDPFLSPGLLASAWARRCDSADAEKRPPADVFGALPEVAPFLLPGLLAGVWAWWCDPVEVEILPPAEEF